MIWKTRINTHLDVCAVYYDIHAKLRDVEIVVKNLPILDVTMKSRLLVVLDFIIFSVCFLIIVVSQQH